MHRTILVLLAMVLGALPPAEAQPIQLEERSVLDGKVVILLPASFELMSDELMRLKYPNERRPKTIFTNPNGSVNVAFNFTSNVVSLNQISKLLGVVVRNFENLYPSAQWYRREIIDIGGRRFFILDLRTPAIDTQIRNIIVGTSLEGRLLFITFNTVQDLEEKWVPVGNEIIGSIRIIE